MKKLFLLLVVLFISGCDSENAPECLKTTGEFIEKTIEVPFFETVIIYDRINLYIKQGEFQEVIVKAGENFIDEVNVSVENNELRISEKTGCNWSRSYGTTTVYITIPNLKKIQHNSSGTIESVGILNFQILDLISLNQERSSNIYTNGIFDLNLECQNLNISNDNLTKYFLTGTTTNFYIGFYNGDGRVEAANLTAQNVNIFHRGSNKIIVNPQESIQGQIRSTGDVISVNIPPIIGVENFYTGQLIFE
ncbi:MAG TPA: head GIN domain-containing protein [Salinimicrobium sp.]|nr:head GIN domain-containing protein [Salinimicrobium sp.]